MRVKVVTVEQVTQIALAFAESHGLPVGAIRSVVRVTADSRHLISVASRVMRGDLWQVSFRSNESPGEITSKDVIFVDVEDDNGQVSGCSYP